MISYISQLKYHYKHIKNSINFGSKFINGYLNTNNIDESIKFPLSNYPDELFRQLQYIDHIIVDLNIINIDDIVKKYCETYDDQHILQFIRNELRIIYDHLTDNTNDINNLDIISDYLRPNQKMAIQKTIEQNFKSGIHSQIMGAGKSIIMLNLIHVHYNSFRENKIYMICTERIDILKKMFYDNDDKLNYEQFNKWKESKVIFMDQYSFLENVTTKNKKMHTFDLTDKPIIYVVNNAFLKTKSNYKKIDDLALILLDECHCISGTVNFKIFEYFKNKNVSIIGFSATPLRQTKNADKQLVKTFSYDDQHLNIISNYDLIEALIDGIVLPFKHIIVQSDMDNKEFIKHVFSKYVKNNDELPYKKGVSWSRYISHIDKNKKIVEEILTDHQIYVHHSKVINDDFNLFCDSETNCLLLCVNCCKEGSDIKNLDYCVYLDNVKKRALNVSLQTAGRVMRPDKNNLKKYAYIIEIIDEDNQIEILTIHKLLNYYKNILNLASYTGNLIGYDQEIVERFLELYSRTIIDQEKSEIRISASDGSDIGIIKLDIKTINWILLKDYLDQEVNRLAGREDRLEDQFKMIINKLKSLDSFKIDNDYWLEYEKLVCDSLGLPNIDELKSKYKEIFDNKSWYELLELEFDYYNYATFKHLLITKYSYIDNLTDAIYTKLRMKHDKLPKYPINYYKVSNAKTLDELLKKN